MSEHRTIRYAEGSEYNAQIVVEPVKNRLREAGWRTISSVWSKEQPGYWDEEFKGHFWAHAAAGGTLTVVYERDLSLPVLPSLQAAIARAATERPDLVEAARSFARRLARDPLPPDPDRSLMDAYAAQQSFVGAYLAKGFLEDPEIERAFAAIPACVRLEIERADTETFLAKFAV